MKGVACHGTLPLPDTFGHRGSPFGSHGPHSTGFRVARDPTGGRQPARSGLLASGVTHEVADLLVRDRSGSRLVLGLVG